MPAPKKEDVDVLEKLRKLETFLWSQTDPQYATNNHRANATLAICAVRAEIRATIQDREHDGSGVYR